MAERSCRPAFSLPFHGLIVARKVDFPNEVPDQFDFLPAVAAGLVRRMNDDLLYKLIDDGGRQFPDAHILPHDGCEAGKTGLILFKGFYRFPPCLDLLHQFILFRLIVGGEFQEPFMADCPADIILIDALENAVKFGNALFRLGNFTLTFPGLSLRFLETLLSRGFLKCHGVVKEQRRHIENPLQHKQFQSFFPDKLHYAVTHHTAAEIVYGRADSTKPNMGLTTWKNAPKGRIRKSDITVAKNYLNETEMRNLNEIVTMYLDYAERQARRGNVMYMADWVKRLDAFLQFNEEDILHDKGKVTAAIAKAFAEKEFEKFRVLQDRTYQSDFDRLVAETSADQTE